MPNMVVFGGGVLGRRLDHKGRAFMNGICDFLKETPESLPKEAPLPFSHVRTAVYKPGSSPAPDVKSASAFIMNCEI